MTSADTTTKREKIGVVKPALFQNFVERRTRWQKFGRAVMLAKFPVKWVINWKGIRG
jgi:hypothetical protein